MNKILVANRGEIARRIMRTARAMGYQTVAVYSDADRDTPFVAEADEAVRIGPAPSAESYLVIEAIISAAKQTSSDAIHPGYGFLAENAEFARACADADIKFIGPTPEAIDRMGSKIEAKRLMQEHGVPVIPGYNGDDQSVETLAAKAREVGFPVLLKASAGGGGKGMRTVHEESELIPGIEGAKREGAASFGDDTLLIEKYIQRPRHIEFQIFGDSHGDVIHVFERECSIQRRHQKIVEEAPSVLLEQNPELRAKMAEAAVAAGKALGYQSAGTVEFIVGDDGSFYFLEVNTRLQVEHPVTEETTGLDLVRWQFLVAEGHPLPLAQDEIRRDGWSIECRLYAEDPANGFLPSTGDLHDWHIPVGDGVRVDTGVEPGGVVSVHYDPMLAKVITTAPTRAEATRLMTRVLDKSSIQGVTTNRGYLARILRTDDWISGNLDTHFVDRHEELLQPAFDHAEVSEPAAIVATLAGVLMRQRERKLLPSVSTGFRNNRWRWMEHAWMHGGDPVQVNYLADGDGVFSVSLGTVEENDERFREWLAERYESDEALQEAWSEEKRKGLQDNESLENADRIPLPLLKTEKFSQQRIDDTQRFEASCVRSVEVLSRRREGRVTLLHVAIDGHAQHWRLIKAAGKTWMHGPRGSVVLESVPRLAAGALEEAGGGYVAPMPGKVLRVLVDVGESVEAGQALMVLEAMKMESTVAAHADGVVAEIFVGEGDLVDADAQLISMESDEE